MVITVRAGSQAVYSLALGHDMDGVGVIHTTNITTTTGTGITVTAATTDMAGTTATEALGILDTSVEPVTWATAEMRAVQDIAAAHRDTWAAACIRVTAAAIISASVLESGAVALAEDSTAAVQDSVGAVSTAADSAAVDSTVEAEASMAVEAGIANG